MMKKIVGLVLSVSIISVACLKVQAQPGVGATYIGDYSKMSSRSAMDKDMENGNWAYRMKNLKSGKYDLALTLKDGSVKQVKSKIYADSLKNKSYVLFTASNGQPVKIYSNQTTKISSTEGNVQVEGVVTDSCWLFPVIKGKINAYSFFPAMGNSYSLAAIQMGNSPVQGFDPQVIAPFVKDDDKAYRSFIKKDYWKALVQFNDSTAQLN